MACHILHHMAYEIINEANAAMLWQTFSDELRVKLQRA